MDWLVLAGAAAEVCDVISPHFDYIGDPLWAKPEQGVDKVDAFPRTIHKDTHGGPLALFLGFLWLRQRLETGGQKFDVFPTDTGRLTIPRSTQKFPVQGTHTQRNINIRQPKWRHSDSKSCTNKKNKPKLSLGWIALEEAHCGRGVL